MFGPAIEATTYRADSYLPIHDEAGLRTAGQDYPDWVADRSLRVPGSVPDRVTALGRDLTATEPMPHDRAPAIEPYLCSIRYTLDLPSPPIDRDLVDHFLFDLRQGYCDYHATAMVVLDRSAGLPARFATGYASGSDDPSSGSYLVSAADALSWPEIYFFSHGWIPFEPTAGLPPVQHAISSAPAVVAPGEEPLEPINARALRFNRDLWLSTTAGLLCLTVMCFAGGGSWTTGDCAAWTRMLRFRNSTGA